jgi:hypothetical protein
MNILYIRWRFGGTCYFYHQNGLESFKFVAVYSSDFAASSVIFKYIIMLIRDGMSALCSYHTEISSDTPYCGAEVMVFKW